ncbi:MAG: A/G-specific adenine glycosylase [Desulfovermiculus sp.]|nr:A/G-specific adenine glycosylase [Desulfovermiculus sp.]
MNDHQSHKPQASEPASDLSSKLLAWYRQNRRDLPWRRDPSPYRVWISEIMLQQTQVDRVVSYFLNWMTVFPHVRAVAEASEDKVLKAWEGLGYYTRARNIRTAAQTLCTTYGQELPSDLPSLLALPGIGPYTAAAIASLAFNQPIPVVEANVQRVMARILNISEPIKSAPVQRRVHQAVQALIPERDSRSLNQALMELGALVCQPRNPSCLLCPAAEDCRSLALDAVHKCPVLPPKVGSTALQVTAGVLVENGRILIQKRPPQGLMANLWEFPGGKVQTGEGPKQALIREFLEELELEVRVGHKITVIRHSYTRFRITLHIYWCQPARSGQEPVLHAATEARWASPGELSQYPFPAADRKLIQILGQENKLPE